ncbi:Mur ligase family protein, partial [Vibrio breoganii]
AYTTQLVKPQVALVNNVAAAHLEGFGSIDGVKQAKGEIFQGLAAGDTAIVNLESNGGDFWKDVLADKNVLTFSESDDTADYFSTNIRINEQGEACFDMQTP